ncbi:sensor domain-containing diguanylate cyclase [Angustibacter sp. Root456]|uniref:sensor domain-containing diguanylate cyclase n=1 Tax=Angustibacter sp. Root456 TaxID=1736539 RepID=UPI0012FBE831|nr:sensor domain-containing diguanylate cyclase [Angustibacter sp. Root456]
MDNPERLAAVARTEMHGHLGDPELDAVVATLRIACSVPIAVVDLVTQNTQTYPAEVGVGAPCTTVPDALSFCAEVVNTRSPLQITDARAHPVYAENPLVVDGMVGAYAGVPLVDDGFVLGTVSIFDDHPRQFTAQEMELLLYQAQLTSSVLRLRRTARTDVLTGLPNRTLFLDRLGHSLRRLEGQPGLVAVMFLDVDGFKALNDSMGHEAGDRALQGLALRLTSAFRSTDTIARLGGDEFAAVCDNLATPECADAIAERVVAIVDEPWILNGTAVDLGASIGITVTDNADDAPTDLMRAADAAMYRAKRIAGSAWVRGAGPVPNLTGPVVRQSQAN